DSEPVFQREILVARLLYSWNVRQRFDALWRGNRERAQLARIDLLRHVGVGSQQRGYMLAQERIHRGRRAGIWHVGETNIRGALNGFYRKMLIARRADAGDRDIARP